MIRTFEEFKFKNPFSKRKIYTHADVDPFGEEEWDDTLNDLLQKENFKAKPVYINNAEFREKKNNVYLHIKEGVNLIIGYYIIEMNGDCHFFISRYFDNPNQVVNDDGLVVVDDYLYDKIIIELGKKFLKNKTYNDFFKRIVNNPKIWKLYLRHLS
jgi:hypothetical protein